MANKSIRQKMTELTPNTIEKIEGMIGRGESVTKICEDLGLEYSVIATYCFENGILSWLGAKRYITNRLNKLKHARRQDDRESLVQEIKEQIDYIYYTARDLAQQKEKVKKSLGIGD